MIRMAIERIAVETKAFVLRFATRTGWWGGDTWGWSQRNRAERAIGDGSGNSIVVAAIGWIARNFPSAVPRVREYDDEEELQKTDDPGALRLQRVLRRPNASYGRVLMDRALVADYHVDGNAYELKVRDATDDRVLSLWWAPSWSLEPRRREGSEDFVSYYEYKPTPNERYELRPEDVIHHRYGFDPDNPMKGRSPLKAVLREIYTDEEAASYTATLLKNLGVPGVIISPGEDVDVEDDDGEAIKQEFRNRFTAESRGEPLVLKANATITRLSFSPQELNLRDIRKLPEERVTGVLGLPAIVAGMGAGLDRSTFANYAEAREAGYEENIVPTQGAWSDDYDIQLLPDFVGDPELFHVDYDLSDVRVLQEDESKIWERYGGAFAKGAITLRRFYQGVGLPVDEEERDAYFVRDARLTAFPEFDPEAIGIPPEEPAGEPEPNAVPPAGVPPVPGAPNVPPGTVPLRTMPMSSNGNGNGKPPVGAGVG
jgi:HK97 family phage portal protein